MSVCLYSRTEHLGRGLGLLEHYGAFRAPARSATSAAPGAFLTARTHALDEDGVSAFITAGSPVLMAAAMSSWVWDPWLVPYSCTGRVPIRMHWWR